MNEERFKAIVRIVVTAVANIANIYGFAVDAEMWVNVVLCIASAVTLIWSWWRNNNITYAAQQGQLVVNRIKNEQRALKMKVDDDDSK